MNEIYLYITIGPIIDPVKQWTTLHLISPPTQLPKESLQAIASSTKFLEFSND